jgi:glycosyltransferase involved in cell wall biosynthesis
MNYKISVVMPVYNEQEYLRASITSILNQSIKEFEFIIINDGSTDETEKIIESFSDPRIKFFKSEKKGIVKQLNYGITLAETPIIARMDADDIAESDRFEEQINYLNHHPEVHVVGSNIVLINGKGKVVCIKDYPRNHEDIEFMMPIESAVCHPAVMIRKEIFENFSYYAERYKHAEDYELFLNLLAAGFKFYNIQKVLLRYRAPILRKNYKQNISSNQTSYTLGINYLTKVRQNNLTENEDYNYYYQMAMIEYYKGSIKRSRGFFFICLRISKKHFFKITRFVLISLLGERIIKYLRKTKVLPLLSLYINSILKIDFHKIK